MRIGIDVTIVGKRGGIPTYAMRLVRALLRLPSNHSFFLWSRSDAASRVARELANGRPTALATAGRIRRVLGDLGEYAWGGRLSLARLSPPLDVVHGLNYGVPLGTGAQAVVTVHDLSVVRFPHWHLRRRVLLIGSTLRRVIPNVTRVITDCEAVRAEVIEHFRLPSERVVSIPHAAPPEFNPRAGDGGGPALARYGLSRGGYLLYAGAIEPRKNLVRLLEAHAVARSRTETPPLVLAGPSGWRNAEIHDRIRAAAPHVRHLGYVPDRDLPVLMAAAAAFVYPSIYEGFGLPALEALACGTPTLLSRIGALEEIAGGVALFVDPLDTEQLADGLVRIITDSDLREHLRDAGPTRAHAFSWERTARETLAVYQAAADEPRPARTA